MLTRLRVNGFKNLVDVDIRFGPFTCIAGANAVGKSNLFDAIRFLSGLADRPLIEAALLVRDEGGRMADLRGLFHRVGDDYDPHMSFEVELIVPSEGVDDLGQKAEASITFLRYTVELEYRRGDSLRALGSLELLKEELVHINLSEAYESLPFPHKPPWRSSAVRGRRTSPFISTEVEGYSRIIKLHQDGRQGRPRSLSAANLPRTALSATNAAESPTALLARNEMRSWRLLQLAPMALRRPDEFTAPTRLGVEGSHLPATLYHLARTSSDPTLADFTPQGRASAVYARVANRLAQLIADVHDVTVDRDERRELLTLLVTDRDGTIHPARALSDGTLRFLALAVLAEDPETQGVLCLEEPENGIHPARIPAMLHLLQEIATDVRIPIGADNPLRQIIVNTHSPSVVKQVPEESLVVARLLDTVRGDQHFKRVCFSSLNGTWRQKETNGFGVPLGDLLAYLNPDVAEPTGPMLGDDLETKRERRVMDRADLQPMLPQFGDVAPA